MAPEPTSTPDDEPTRVSPASAEAPAPEDAPRGGVAAGEPPKDVVTDAPLWPDPAGSEPGPRAAAGDVPRPAADDVPPADAPPGAEESGAKRRARSAADRTAEGAKVAADKVSQAASATAQALRETDVNEIARHTTRLIENTRPFFLAAFAIVFTFLAAVENHAAIGVVFAVAAVLCVLGAAFSPAVDHLFKRTDRDGR
jgi:hypothetical protein